jgi:hypothetical protein
MKRLQNACSWGGFCTDIVPLSRVTVPPVLVFFGQDSHFYNSLDWKDAGANKDLDPED